MSPSSFLFSYFCCISTKIWTSYHGLQDSYHLVLSKFTLCHSSLLFFIQIGLLNIFSGHPTCQTPCSFRTFACNSAFIWSVFLFPLCITSFFSSSSSLYGNVLHLTSTSPPPQRSFLPDYSSGSCLPFLNYCLFQAFQPFLFLIFCPVTLFPSVLL